MKFIISALAAIFIFAGCASTSLPPVSKDVKFEEDEKRLWLRSEEEQKVLNKSGLIYKDEELESYLNEVARKIQPPEVFAHVPFKIIVIKNHLLNAFAFPNGVIYVHTGILARMDNEAQLATLLAHEMTHATHRHTVKQFRDMKNKSAFLATMQVTLGSMGSGMGDLATLLGSLGTLAAVTGYSRELEAEADTEGLKLVCAAGYDPKEASKLFMHLKREVEEEQIKEPFFFGSHPRLQERIENYERLLETQYRDCKNGVQNQEVFLKKITKVILENALLDLKAGRFAVAQRGIEKYLTLSPHDAKAYYLLGEIFRQKGEKDDIEKAQTYYQKAIALNPYYPEPHKGLGLIYFKQRELLRAKKALELYLSLSGNPLDRAYIEEYIKQCREGSGQ